MKLKRTLALLLALVIAISAVPASAIAESIEEETAVTAEAAPVKAVPAAEIPSVEIPAAEIPAEEAAPMESASAEAAAVDAPAEPPEQLPTEAAAEAEPAEEVYPWSGMDDIEFAAFLQAAENNDFLRAILADTGSVAYAALMDRVAAIADDMLSRAAQSALAALTAPAEEIPAEEAPVEERPAEETPAEDIPAEEPFQEIPAEEAAGPVEEASEEPARAPEPLAVEAPAEEFIKMSETLANTGLPESPHPYANNTDRSWNYTISGAASLWVTFSSDTQVESNYDYIYIYRGTTSGGTLVGSYSGTQLAGQTIVVTGSSVCIRLTSDSSGTDYGFRVTNIQASSGTCGDSLNWTMSGSTLTITGSGAMTDWDSLSEVPWYSQRARITSVVLPQGITGIGTYAFSGCSSLIGITIPASVTSIGGDAFNGCSRLARVDIRDLSAWCRINFFNANGNPLTYAKKLYLNGSPVTSLVIPNDVTAVSSFAFFQCSSLTSVTIPNTVTSIGRSAFYRCSGLTSLEIPASITDIRVYSFGLCIGLTSITIPASVTSIAYGAFVGCDYMTDVYYGGSQAQWNAISIEDCNDPFLRARIHCSSAPVSTAALESFVTRLYSICLGRAPGASELSYYVNQLAAGTTTGVAVASNFVFSNEFKAKNLCNEHYVTYLYRVFFDRAPGASELTYHVNRLSGGAKREEIFNGFALSNEYKALCQSYGITQGTGISVPAAGTVPTGACTVSGCSSVTEKIDAFIRRLYIDCLGRSTVAASEVAYYRTQLQSKAITGTQIAWNFFSSPEFTNQNLSSSEYVTRLYKVLMGRSPAASELSYHVNRLNSGAGRKDIFNGFAMSTEFLNICNSYGIERGSAIG